MSSLNLSWTHLYKLQYFPSCFCFLLVYDKLPHLEAQSIAHFIFRQIISQTLKRLDEAHNLVPQYIPLFETANRANSSTDFL